jgi:hypothetical protein
MNFTESIYDRNNGVQAMHESCKHILKISGLLIGVFFK